MGVAGRPAAEATGGDRWRPAANRRRPATDRRPAATGGDMRRPAATGDADHKVMLGSKTSGQKKKHTHFMFFANDAVRGALCLWEGGTPHPPPRDAVRGALRFA